MAISGGMTTAYNVTFKDGKLHISNTTAPAYLCMEPREATGIVRSGKQATIQGSKMAEFNKLWRALV